MLSAFVKTYVIHSSFKQSTKFNSLLYSVRGNGIRSALQHPPREKQRKPLSIHIGLRAEHVFLRCTPTDDPVEGRDIREKIRVHASQDEPVHDRRDNPAPAHVHKSQRPVELQKKLPVRHPDVPELFEGFAEQSRRPGDLRGVESPAGARQGRRSTPGLFGGRRGFRRDDGQYYGPSAALHESGSVECR